MLSKETKKVAAISLLALAGAGAASLLIPWGKGNLASALKKGAGAIAGGLAGNALMRGKAAPAG